MSSKMRHLGRYIKGFGAYKVGGNSLMSGGLSPPAVINSMNNGNVIIRHREYIGDVIASAPFANTAFPLNPGMGETFPWLSQIATSFEKYRWRGMIFEFKSMSSDAVLSTSTSSALGTVIMSTLYNPYDDPFTSKIQMENYEFANSCKPSCSMIHPIECARRTNASNIMYIRTSNVIEGDLRLYDPGTFNIAVQGMQASTGVIGELWVSFEVEFISPKFSPSSDIPFAHFGTSNASITNYNPPTADHVFGTILNGLQNVFPLNTSGSTLGCYVDTFADRLHFPSAPIGSKYLITMTMLHSGAAGVVALNNFGYTGCSTFSLFKTSGADATPFPATATDQLFINTFCIITTSTTGVYVQGNSFATYKTVTAHDLIVQRIPSAAVVPELSE